MAEFYLEETWLGVLFLVIMFGIFYYIGWTSRRRTVDADDFYAAGFTIGPVVNGLAMAATWASLATFLGVSALILQLQVPFVYLWIQWALSIPLITLLYGTSLRRIKTFTPAGFMRLRYGNEVTVMVAGWMTLVAIMYALGQMVGLGATFELLFGIPYTTAVIISGFATLGFIIIGGMYGASFNAAFQCAVMLVAMIAPMGAVLYALDSSGWWFPPLGYADMIPALLAEMPDFFDTRYEFRWYLALIFPFTLGPVALPHLAMRVFTSASLPSARAGNTWFVFFLGLLFTASYSIGFVGNYFTATTGTVIENPDHIYLVLSVVYTPQAVAAFVMAGAIAAGLSTIAGNLMAISALVGNDLINVIAPHWPSRKKMTLGYISLAGGGVIALVLAFSPPEFLVTSILWAFGILASTVTPGLLLGVWWKKANKLAMMISGMICGITYLVISPHVLPGIVVGEGVTASLGMSGALVTVPLSFFLFITLSLIFDRVKGLHHLAPSMEEKKLVDRIHGWGEDYDENRYNWTLAPAIMAIVFLAIFFWGLVPWS